MYQLGRVIALVIIVALLAMCSTSNKEEAVPADVQPAQRSVEAPSLLGTPDALV